MELLNRAPTFWRKIRLNATQGYVVGEVEDNVHHFAVSLRHDGASITDVTALAIRFPWTTCPAATGVLKALVGTSVLSHARANVDQSLQCTHMLDLAKLAISQIIRGGQRNYDILVRNGDTSDTCIASINRDNGQLLEWKVRVDIVLSPILFEGHCVTGRAVWQLAVEADADLREAALVLRRSLFIFRSRPRSFFLQRANELEELRNACFSFQSPRINEAVRPLAFSEIQAIPEDMPRHDASPRPAEVPGEREP